MHNENAYGTGNFIFYFFYKCGSWINLYEFFVKYEFQNIIPFLAKELKNNYCKCTEAHVKLKNNNK